MAQTVYDHRAVSVLDSGRTCSGADHDGCLTEVSGRLTGPFDTDSRGGAVAPTWRLDGRSIQLSDGNSARLAASDDDKGLVYDGQLVAVRGAGGAEVRSNDLGSGWAVLWIGGAVLLTLLAAGLAWVTWRLGRLTRRQAEAPAR